MSESQRIGQLFIIGLTRDHLDAAERTAVAQFHFGSLSFTAKTSAGVAAVRAIVDAVQAEATPTATGRVKFLVAANQEGGLIQALSGPGFDVMPSALSQGTLAPADLERMAARWGRELRASPGEGYPVAHRREQDRIVRVALGDTSLYRDATFVGGLGSA